MYFANFRPIGKQKSILDPTRIKLELNCTYKGNLQFWPNLGLVHSGLIQIGLVSTHIHWAGLGPIQYPTNMSNAHAYVLLLYMGCACLSLA